MGRKRSFINSEDILEFWGKDNSYVFRKKEINLGWMFKFQDKEEFCFCCGDIKGIQKAHIIPVSSGGIDAVENLHLLCNSCHLRTEAMTDIPIIGMELYKDFIVNHPDLRSFREFRFYEIVSKLNTDKQKELCNLLIK